MHDAYRCAVMAECPMVLGRRLLPFSLWHAFALEAFDSPYANGTAPNHADVVLAAWICSRGFEDAQDCLRTKREEMLAECKAWGAAVGIDDVRNAASAIAQYIADHVKSPPKIQTAGSELSIPWPLAYFWKLSNGKLDRETVVQTWDMPVPWAVAYVSASAIAAGDDTFMTEEVAAALEAARLAMKKEQESGNG